MPSETRDFCGRLQDAFKNRSNDFTEANLALLLQRFEADGFAIPRISSGLSVNERFAADMFDVRMFFSALVDADYLETEAHFQGNADEPRLSRLDGPSLDLDKAIAAWGRHIDRMRREHGDAPMAAPREALLEQCIKAAFQPTGLFSLSAPTGAGKTLAMLGFALHHARVQGLRRVILVMPFLNIIDQTAAVYRSIFSPEEEFPAHTVVEHHSLAEAGDGVADGRDGDHVESQRRLLAENWDAPIILTTNVQFFESLMAARPARCRKLHRLARSVILFDEVQTIPAKLAVATLATLSRLAEPGGPYRSTVVFATATQPAFDVLHHRIIKEPFASAGWQPTEIVADAKSLYWLAAKRVRVAWRHQTPIELDQLAAELCEHERVLAIVNLKRHALRMAASVQERRPEGLLHLSTNMCPAHRAAVLEEVNHRLKVGKPVRLVATQCVEAGVDLDFPIVYRALAPLEAIAQAAGRCNRHGKGPPGQVVVFKPHDPRGLYPPGYGAAALATESFVAAFAEQGELDDAEILNSPEKLRRYFQRLYRASGRDKEERDDERKLLDAVRERDFAETAELCKLIRQDSIQVLVPYDRPAVDQLRAEITDAPRLSPEFIRNWTRRAGPHSVSLFRPQSGTPIWNHLTPVLFRRRPPLENFEASWFFALDGLEYDKLMGLTVSTENSWIA